MTMDELWLSIAKDAPVVAALIYIAHTYMKKHEGVVKELVDAFKEETKHCRETNKSLMERVFRLEQHNDYRS
jgi:uncharacterized protein (UPF0332 family)